MPASKVNAWYGWVPDQPDYRDKLYAAIAAPPKKLPSKVDLRAGGRGLRRLSQPYTRPQLLGHRLGDQGLFHDAIRLHRERQSCGRPLDPPRF
jgi:hypothetical protein